MALPYGQAAHSETGENKNCLQRISTLNRMHECRYNVRMQQNRTSPFDIRGTKVVYLILAVIANLAFALAFFSFVDWLLLNYGEAVTGVDTTLMLGLFMGALLIAFLISFLAKDNRGITYGLFGSLGGFVLALVRVWNSSILLAILVGLMSVMGGFNGGLLGENFRRNQQRRKKKQ